MVEGDSYLVDPKEIFCSRSVKCSEYVPLWFGARGLPLILGRASMISLKIADCRLRTKETASMCGDGDPGCCDWIDLPGSITGILVCIYSWW